MHTALAGHQLNMTLVDATPTQQVDHLPVELQLIGRQVSGIGVVPRVSLRLEGRAVDPDPPQLTAEQALRVRRQRRAVFVAALPLPCRSTRAPFALARLRRAD